MIICICANQTEDEIRALVKQGFRTMEDLMYESGVALGCAMCRYDVERILVDENKCKLGQTSKFSIAIIKPF